jgi:hypothetical protein
MWGNTLGRRPGDMSLSKKSVETTRIIFVKKSFNKLSEVRK